MDIRKQIELLARGHMADGELRTKLLRLVATNDATPPVESLAREFYRRMDTSDLTSAVISTRLNFIPSAADIAAVGSVVIGMPAVEMSRAELLDELAVRTPDEDVARYVLRANHPVRISVFENGRAYLHMIDRNGVYTVWSSKQYDIDWRVVKTSADLPDRDLFGTKYAWHANCQEPEYHPDYPVWYNDRMDMNIINAKIWLQKHVTNPTLEMESLR